MMKKIVPIVTIVLAIGLFAFICVVQNQDKKVVDQYESRDEQSRTLKVKQKQLEQELETLEKTYEKSKAPNAVGEIIFTDLNEQIYSVCYPIMQEYEYTGTLALSMEKFPGEEGCMTVEQFRELMEAGWDICITWQTETAVNRWWPNFQNKLTVLGVEPGEVVYFPSGTYSADAETAIQELGFKIAVVYKGGDESPLQLQYEEGIWHVGAVGLMSTKPRLWLNEAVAQDANVAYLVGFEAEEELYNEKSFRSMLNCLDEYEATDELIVTNIDDARDHYYIRSIGLAPEVESQYQQQKVALEEELAEIKEQLDKIGVE